MKKFTLSIHETSNPKIIKFETDSFLTKYESFEFSNIDDAKNSPLAQQLFHLPFVKKVYISGNFVAIERYDIVEWSAVQTEVGEQIENYLNEGGLVITTESKKKNPVTIYAESTPNPGVQKFVANKNLVSQTFEFTSIEDAKLSPFATALFQFPFVKAVFIDKNYVSVTKFDIVEWDAITLELREFMKSYIEEGKEMVTASAAKVLEKTTAQLDDTYETLDDTSKEIINILEQHIKPAVASDGGNILFESYDAPTKTVKVILQGACSGCPSSTFTLKSGIEALLKEMMAGKVEIVEAING
ncbi:NifU family protein [Flavobacteriaceae bacterium]|nr:NifU family protein [Flavobacteriaceae bacterium]MDC1540366.1 NifU family protein [Flavobacteriaceae bacterium]